MSTRNALRLQKEQKNDSVYRQNTSTMTHRYHEITAKILQVDMTMCRPTDFFQLLFIVT